ncbi:dehypoxanthine futalosine cyclase, partial [Streptomyces xanthophaeus]
MTDQAALQSVLDRAAAGGRITKEEALDLYRHAPLHALGQAADAVRRLRYAGTEHIATYIIERNINYTNVCVTACKFCAFYAAPKDA